MFAAFKIFVAASGATILIRIINIWFPLYQFSIALKIICATASIPAGILFAWRSQAIAKNITRFFDLLVSDQQRSEALRKSEEFLERTGTIAGVGGWEVDLVTNEVTWSAETYRIHRVPLDYKPTLKEGLAFYTPECRPIITAAVQRACEGGEGWDLELSVTRCDGVRIWVRTVGAAELKDGVPIRLAGAFQDVTARVAERTALRDANERVALATDSGGIGIWDWDIAKGFVHCDRWMHRLHGMTYTGEPADEMLWREQLHPDDRESVVGALHDALAGGKPYDMEFRVLWQDGSIHNIRATAQISRDDAGEPIRMVGANWDVTESRQLTAALAQQHELLRVTLQSIGDGVITTDAYSNITWMNPVAERMTAWSVSEAIGLPITEVFQIVHAESGAAVNNPVVVCLASRSATNLAPNTNLISRDGSQLGIEDSAAPILGDRGELRGAVLVFHDATEQRSLIAETRRVDKMELKLKDDFLSHVSHELRSPLTSIYSFSSIIADGLAGSTTAEQKQYLGIVLKNVEQLQFMIEDLLTVTQMREGKLSIHPQAISAQEAVSDTIDTMQGAAARKNLSLRSECQIEIDNAYADPTRLRQILIILLDNAIKFTPEGGTISVQVSEESAGYLLVQVSDTGCGIPPEQRGRVFENLYQIDRAGQGEPNGSGRNGLGLGLHIAKDLVTRQGGRIRISDAPQRGTVFSFTVPTCAGKLAGFAASDEWMATA
ncbi:ATP-binding protein [Granulicella sibirica]|uniref:ATP-binding protein n=1 Tax=Granulicella sibirica TaxID=2479048 RepID=UPI0013758D82|nr:ATP-binding protein [Granulicella sibirica]